MAHFPFPLSQVHRSWWGWTGKLSHTLPRCLCATASKHSCCTRPDLFFLHTIKKKKEKKETSWFEEITTAANFHLTKPTKSFIADLQRKNLSVSNTSSVKLHLWLGLLLTANLTLVYVHVWFQCLMQSSNPWLTQCYVSMCAVRLSATRTQCFSEDHHRLRRGPCPKSWPGSRQKRDATCCPSREHRSHPLHMGMCSFR